MQTVVSRKELLSVARECNRAVDRKVRLPIMSHLLLQAKGDSLRVAGARFSDEPSRYEEKANPMDVCIRKVAADVIIPGAVAVPSADFVKALASFTNGHVELTLCSAPTKGAQPLLELREGEAAIALSTLPANEFPVLPKGRPATKAARKRNLKDTPTIYVCGCVKHKVRTGWARGQDILEPCEEAHRWWEGNHLSRRRHDRMLKKYAKMFGQSEGTWNPWRIGHRQADLRMDYAARCRADRCRARLKAHFEANAPKPKAALTIACTKQTPSDVRKEALAKVAQNGGHFVYDEDQRQTMQWALEKDLYWHLNPHHRPGEYVKKATRTICPTDEQLAWYEGLREKYGIA